MPVQITNPANGSQFQRGNAVEFKGTADDGVIQVKLLAEDTYLLGDVKVVNGTWSVVCPFNRRGKRRIIAKGFNSSNKQISSDGIDIFIVASSADTSDLLEFGIDVSNHNGTSINWQHVKSADISFAFVKATEGGTFKDSTFTTNWRGIQNAGIIRGAYHFFRPLKSIEEQVKNFLDVVVKLAPSDLPPALDLEHFPDKVRVEWDQLSLNERIDRAKTWLDKVEQKTGRKPIIYTSPSFWEEFMGDTQAFTDHALWLANYVNPANNPGNKKPKVPANNWGRKGFTFWQHTEDGTVAGVSGKVDRNRFNGSFDRLVAFVEESIVTA
ncbi:MAG: hypothetical protein KME08_21575 [Aphanothece sp. CMT-3BRIN-NPC111]|jgi:GH25 family lysozyme M1 (1,4-beta-N-acetylmuramidase)|nr:hypothetical protein [Aphanothece sp. CMT-3BRIN-NPC111]